MGNLYLALDLSIVVGGLFLSTEELILCPFSFSAWNAFVGFTMKWARLISWWLRM